MIDTILNKTAAGINLTMGETTEAINSIMRGEWDEDSIVRLLATLSEKGETVEEVAGAAAALRQNMTPIRSTHPDVIDTCGTGGDGKHTFNVSTTAALVTAAAGVPVAKHGNRGISSRSGSADALQQLGVNIEADVSQIEQCLEQLGICFCFAPLMHQAMKHVGPARKKFGRPSIFNMLGPLCNPASARFQLIGVGRPEIRDLLARACAMLGTRRTVVVHGDDGLCEITTATSTSVTIVDTEGTFAENWAPADFGLETSPVESLVIDTPAESAAIIRDVLDGQHGPARDIVILNAAAALWTAGRAESRQVCATLAAAVIDDGSARDLLDKLVEMSNGRI